MSTKASKKLLLNRETVRSLGETALRRVAGGLSVYFQGRWMCGPGDTIPIELGASVDDNGDQRNFKIQRPAASNIAGACNPSSP